MSLEAANGEKDQTWATPRWVFERIERAAGVTFELDVCAEDHTAKCPDYYTVETDGLVSPWRAANYCNPPYEDIAKWLGRARYWRDREGYRTVFLIPARVGMSWFIECREDERAGKAAIAFWPGRIAFEGMGKSPYEYSVVIGIGAGLEGLYSLECPDRMF